MLKWRLFHFHFASNEITTLKHNSHKTYKKVEEACGSMLVCWTTFYAVFHKMPSLQFLTKPTENVLSLLALPKAHHWSGNQRKVSHSRAD